MRPLELRLHNFRSYFGDETVFSFRDRSLVGIVGPIGAGKSSILDAIAFALYGKTPTVGAATRSLIHQRAADAKVALRFEVDGQVWEAQRLLRRKGQSQHALYRFTDDDPDREPAERITLEAEVNAKVVELLGLEFDAFGRSVLLAQNRFAEFLHAKPVDRDKVLKGVFGHERLDLMREAAKARVAALRVESGELAARIEQVDRVAARLAERRESLELLGERLEALQKAQPAVAELEAVIAETIDAREAAERRLAEIRGLADILPEPTDTERLFAEAAGADERRTALAAALEASQVELAGAERALADADAAGSSKVIDEASSLLATLAPLQKGVADAERRLTEVTVRREEVAGTRQAAAARIAGADAAVADAESQLAARTADVAAAEAEVQQIRHAEMAMTLRLDLHPGDDCPVCAQRVTDVPAVEMSADLQDALAVHREAIAARDRADEKRLAATAEVHAAREAQRGIEAEADRLDGELDAAKSALERSRAERDATSERLTGLLGGSDFGALLGRLKTEDARRQDAAARARKAVERARSDHDAAIREQQEVRKRLSALHVDLAGLVAKLDVPVAIEDDTPAALQGAVTDVRDAWTSATTELEDRRARAAEAEAVARRERRGLLDSLDVQDDFASALASTQKEAELLAQAVAEDEAELAGSTELIDRRRQLEASQARFEQITADLTDSKFVRYLLDDEKTRLAALGSEHFQRLSSGRYRFSEDGKFEIVDLTAADAVRRADSLSGGETFLASLALALALAEMVARTGGRLDAFFIDEGFGSLDPEHLDLAMEGIEVLATDGTDRLVVVVSHVPEMRHRIEDLIELERSPTTGDSQVVRS